MALEPITRQEQIIAGKDLQPITRLEKFLKEYGGGAGGGGSGGGTAFKTFTLTLGDGATLKLTDMGNDLVHVHFQFKGSVKNGGTFEYQIPTDNSEYVAWATDKVFVFGSTLFIGTNLATEGANEATYALGNIFCMNTEDGSINSIMLEIYNIGDNSEINQVSLDTTVTALSLDFFQ